MKYTEEKKDLFTLPKDYMLVHCISADFAMGAGIAKRFTLLGVRDALYRCQAYGSLHTRGYFDGKGYCMITREEICGWKVANLVTKNRYYDKPTYKTLRDALHDLKKHLENFPEVRKLGMPLIGCGLDKLQWDKVKGIIEDQFGDTDYEITVCRL